MLFLDRWEGFAASLGDLDGGALQDAIFQLMREGASVGMHVIMSGDRTLLLGRISTLTENKMALQLSDPADVSLIGLNPRKVPARIPPGRAFRAQGGVETHVALLAEDPADQSQSAALQAIGASAKDRDSAVPRSRRPFRVDVLPGRIGYEEAWELRDTQEIRAMRHGGRLWSMAAVGGDQLTALGPDLADGTPAFVIAGPARSGRSTALLTMIRSLLSVGTQVIVAAPRPQSPLRRLQGAEGVVGFFTGDDLAREDLEAAVERLAGPGVTVMDDAELLRTCDAGEFLQSVLRGGTGRDLAIVIAGDAEDVCGGFSGWQVDLKKARRGLLLSPQNMSDADLIGARFQRGSTGQAVQPGRGLLHLGDGRLHTVQSADHGVTTAARAPWRACPADPAVADTPGYPRPWTAAGAEERPAAGAGGDRACGSRTRPRAVNRRGPCPLLRVLPPVRTTQAGTKKRRLSAVPSADRLASRVSRLALLSRCRFRLSAVGST